MTTTFANVSSTAIGMFPSSRRTGVDPYSRFTTELNLVDIVNRISTGNFVSKFDSDTGDIEFTIAGYNFRTTITAIGTALGTLTQNNIVVTAITNYSGSEIVQDTTLSGYEGSGSSLNTSMDNNSKFIGLQFAQISDDTTVDSVVSEIETAIGTANPNAKVFGLKLFTKVNNSWEVPSESFERFNADYVNTDELNINVLDTEDIDTVWDSVFG